MRGGCPMRRHGQLKNKGREDGEGVWVARERNRKASKGGGGSQQYLSQGGFVLEGSSCSATSDTRLLHDGERPGAGGGSVREP